MKLIVLDTIADGRADAIRSGIKPPYVAHLPPKRFARLMMEIAHFGACFGLPLDGFVPDHREDDYVWIYLGIVLSDVHVYGRLR